MHWLECYSDFLSYIYEYSNRLWLIEFDIESCIFTLSMTDTDSDPLVRSVSMFQQHLYY